MFTPAESFFTPEQLAAAERLAGDLTLAPLAPHPLAPRQAAPAMPINPSKPAPQGRIGGVWM